MNNGQEASKWLARITEDQNLNQLSELENVPYDTLRRLFVSAMLQPNIQFGYYDNNDNRIVLGPYKGQLTDVRTQVSVVSAASSTLTCPAGYAYKVLAVICANDTRGPHWDLTYTPYGQTAIQLYESATASTQSAHYALFNSPGYVGIAASSGINIGDALWMQPGDTLEATNNNFVAGDAMFHQFLFVRVAL